MFATSGSRCPGRYLERPILKRLQHIRNSGPLYVQSLSKPKPDVWYSIQPVRINKIDRFMKKIVTMGGLDTTKKHFTNHNVRKTTIKQMMSNMVVVMCNVVQMCLLTSQFKSSKMLSLAWPQPIPQDREGVSCSCLLHRNSFTHLAQVL